MSLWSQSASLSFWINACYQSSGHIMYRFRFLTVTIFLFLMIISDTQMSGLMAQTITLEEATPLKIKPEISSEVSIYAKKGDVINVVSNSREWVYLAYKGKNYYTEFGNLYKIYTGNIGFPVSASSDATCDYGYTYSGSNIYFERPLAKMRHSDPLGFLFGNHERYPC